MTKPGKSLLGDASKLFPWPKLAVLGPAPENKSPWPLGDNQVASGVPYPSILTPTDGETGIYAALDIALHRSLHTHVDISYEPQCATYNYVINFERIGRKFEAKIAESELCKRSISYGTTHTSQRTLLSLATDEIMQRIIPLVLDDLGDYWDVPAPDVSPLDVITPLHTAIPAVLAKGFLQSMKAAAVAHDKFKNICSS